MQRFSWGCWWHRPTLNPGQTAGAQLPPPTTMNRYTAIAGVAGLMLAIGACRGALSQQDLSGYSIEIDSLNRIEAMNKTGSDAFTSMGNDSEAQRFLEISTRTAARARCLKRQREERMPYVDAAKGCRQQVPIPGVDD